MVKFTFNNQLEYKSFVTFLYWIQPWQCTSYNHDLGIDLYVQPFDERDRNKNDRSIIATSKRILIQLKSTEEILKKEFGTHSIDTTHLLDWKRQEDLVVLIKYYHKHDQFFYAYIEDIDVKKKNKTQTIHLLRKLERNSIEDFQNEVLDRLYPPKINDIEYIPDLKTGEISFVGSFDLGRIENISTPGSLGNAKYDQLLKTFETKINKENTIFQLKRKINRGHSANDHFNLIAILLSEGKKNEAKNEALSWFEKQPCQDVKLILYILNNNMDLTELKSFKEIFYIKWEREIPSGTAIKAVFTNNEIAYELQEMKEGILEIPFTKIGKIKLTLEFKLKDPSGPSPNVTKGSVRLFRSYSYKGELIEDFEELIKILM